MTDMKITGCVPLPGQGLVARHGDLVAVTEGDGLDPDPLLGALDEVAATAGDGGALVLAVARAMLANPDTVSGACAGVTAGGQVAVLVHGSAVATIVVDGGQEVQLTSNGSLLPVNRTFSGASISIRLALGSTGDPDARLRLDGGVVSGDGLAVTASTDPAGPGRVTSEARQAPDDKTTLRKVPKKQGAAPGGARPDAAVTPGPVSASDAPTEQADIVQPGGGPDPELTVPPSGGLGSKQETYLPPPEDADRGQWEGEGWHPPTERADIGPAGDEEWHTSTDHADLGQAGAEGWSPPFEFMPSTPPASRGREPQLHEPDPAADFEWISLVPEPGGQDARDQARAPEADGAPPLEGAEPALVEGALCARNHFNDPSVAYCRQCGLSMVQQTRRTQLGQRPPLGVLLLDDGTGFTLDRDYVLGREPVLDGDVAAGRARPLRITDPGGTVGRVHLRVSLIGWQVEVKDLGSVNGSVLYQPAGEQKLNPYDPVVVEPGARIGLGQRSVQYLSYRAA
jgi:hypothetical protein